MEKAWTVQSVSGDFGVLIFMFIATLLYVVQDNIIIESLEHHCEQLFAPSKLCVEELQGKPFIFGPNVFLNSNIFKYIW